MIRFGGFRTRIAVSFLTLIAVVQIAVLIAVHAANRASAHEQIENQLGVAGRVFERLSGTRNHQLTEAARLLASDFAFIKAVATDDQPTLLSAMNNHRARMNADVMMLASLDERHVADTLGLYPRGAPFAFPSLIDRAQEEGQARTFTVIDGGLYQVVVVPVLAPVPVAWALMGLRIDDAFARDLQKLTLSDVSFVWQAEGGSAAVMASTLPAPLSGGLLGARGEGVWTAAASTVKLAGTEYVSLARQISPPDQPAVTVILQRPLAQAMQQFRRVELTLVTLFLAGLIVSVVAGLRIARAVSRPLLVLAEGARRLEKGDYAHRVSLAQQDEVGQLAVAFNSMAQGISEREEQLTYQAYHDGLTGLPNRALFHNLLQQAITTARRDHEQLGVLLLDLDRFKEVNDTLGHDVGDLILQQVGSRLAGAVRESDTVARLGGDECAVLLRALTDRRDAFEVVHRIRCALEQPFVVENQPIELAASVGIAFYPDHGEDGTTLVRHADVAMYGAKRSASGVAVYAVEMDPNSPRRLALLGELRQAIERDGLTLYYQPKVDLASNRVTDVEALLRWHHPQHGLLPPGDFIPLAEQTGLMGPLTFWVLGEALRQVTAWRDEGIDLGVAVNLSARVLQDEQFPDRVAALLTRFHVRPSKLVLEITESAIMADPACAMRIVTGLHELGVRLSVDDFGTGYSSLAYLKKLPVDELKIDRSFVIDLEAKSHDEVIVRSTIDLAHNLGMRVTAEGVESHEVLETLRRYGCDYAQGYFISHPVPARALAQWLRRSSRRLSLRALPLATARA